VPQRIGFAGDVLRVFETDGPAKLVPLTGDLVGGGMRAIYAALEYENVDAFGRELARDQSGGKASADDDYSSLWEHFGHGISR
jgi:hypothetical protein